MLITCPTCGAPNEFVQPDAYHAGFSDQGFLYNDAGNLTLIWSSFDSAYTAIVGPHSHPWALTDSQRERFENQLLPAPHGGRWRFANPPRCGQCREPIGSPIVGSIYYVVYPGSINTEKGAPDHPTLADLLSGPRPASM